MAFVQAEISHPRPNHKGHENIFPSSTRDEANWHCKVKSQAVPVSGQAQEFVRSEHIKVFILSNNSYMKCPVPVLLQHFNELINRFKVTNANEQIKYCQPTHTHTQANCDSDRVCSETCEDHFDTLFMVGYPLGLSYIIR
jgi:hypothetical protein